MEFTEDDVSNNIQFAMEKASKYGMSLQIGYGVFRENVENIIRAEFGLDDRDGNPI